MSPESSSTPRIPSGFACLLQTERHFHPNGQWSGVIPQELLEAYVADSLEAIRTLANRMEFEPEFFSDLASLEGLRGPAICQRLDGEYVLLGDVSQLKGGALAIGGLDEGGKWCVKRFDASVLRNNLTGKGVFLRSTKEFDNIRHSSVWALSLVAHHHRIPLEPQRILHDYAIKEDELTERQMVRIGRENHLKIGLKGLSWKELETLGRAYPAILVKQNGRHAIACGWNAADKTLAVMDPEDPPKNGGRFTFWTEEDYSAKTTGRLYLIKRQWGFFDADRPFGISWFFPEFLKQKGAFAHIAFAVLMINAIALGTPLFFQIIVDKVLVNQSYSTLQVMVFAICGLLVFNGILEFLRGYLLLFATSKIDISTTTQVFNKLMRLPIDFFDRIPSGVLLKHVQQTEKIRGFLSGSLFFTLLELTSLVVFVPFLLLYSGKLTCIVLGFSLAIAAVIALLIKPFQKRLNQLYEAEGKRQAMLVESIHGMRTVKSLSLEPVQKEAWENSTAYAVKSYFRVGRISVTAKSLCQFLEMLMSVCVIWLGAMSVFDGTLTVGALIAFQMISGRVTGPLVRIVGLIHEYQQVAISVKMLGVVMNATPEPTGGGVRMPVRGNISFDHVTFQYTQDTPPVLRDLSFQLEPGGVYGIVGRSGSGKTTLTKLLQGLYPTNSGLVKVDGIDIREFDKVHLRNSIGVVLQDNYFFSGTVKENLSLTRRNATHDEIISAARLAGADEFVQNLPKGYDTMLEENASNLSGGQRQRLAIARALLTNPRILIFDEATSALDPESENVIQENLPKLSAGRTVLVISHRLSMISGATKTLVLDKGQLVDFGTHRELLSRPGVYKDFWHQQMERNMAR